MNVTALRVKRGSWQVARAAAAMALTVCMLLGAQAAPAAPAIPPELKNAPVFIFYQTDGQDFKAHGTGFLVAAQASKSSETAGCYLVTAKHVLYKEKDRLPAIFMRLNSKTGAGDTELKYIELYFDGDRKNVFLHPDNISDVAIVRLSNQDMSRYQCSILPRELVISKDDVRRLGIGEGTESFFCGLFIHHAGRAHTSPILRFGHLAMMTDEKIRWADAACDLYLFEMTTFAGNSGSPAFFCLDESSPEKFKLAGIVIGAINMNTGAAADNSGIAAVVPSYKIHEILNSKELKDRR